jgi:hypothetical protein
MKRELFVVAILGIICFSLPLGYAQNLLSNPESIEYDFHSNLFFVSNWGDGNIIQIDTSGQQSIFHAGFTRLAGLYKYGTTLYAAANLDPYVGVYGMNMGTGEIVANIPIPGTGLLNDITSDTSGNLYVTDFYDSKIYKIRLSDYTVSLFVDAGLGNPNGIVFDDRHNRLLTACQGEIGRPIRAISLADSSVSVLVNTNFDGVDGLAFDNENRLYFSAWQTNAVYRYDTAYANEPELVADGYNGPADIYINRLSNLLCVPDFYNDTIKFVPISPSSIENEPVPTGFVLAQNYPNPFNQSTAIDFALSHDTHVTVDIYNITGQRVRTLVDDYKLAGSCRLIWDGTNELGQAVATGMYLYRLQTESGVLVKKMVMLK